ncbi:hypothetical protein CERSUDRAFT_52911 [Gelatoporia subvermispora B]|uniref:Cytochrome P450 n=1 Tax=Ceriporiopsis subvermispora (strain B) TaxID=914234 RepID=M2PIL2_CERS8|nr:hypothetical protein CERSUDRAFT_52911 [Gelatoporia subvermispora B]
MIDLEPAWLGLILLGVFTFYAAKRGLRSTTGIHPYPPGPPMRPLIGNIMEVGSRYAWLKLTGYKEQYGDLVYFQGLGKSVLVVNSLKAILDLLEKRANNYSDRPVLIFGNDLIGMNRTFLFADYGEEWRAQRKLAHAALGPSAVKDYISMQENVSIELSRELIKAPQDFYSLIRLAAGRTVITVTYGVRSASAEQEFIILAEEINRVCQKAAIPGAYLCDFVPWLKYAPSWVPFQRVATYGRRLLDDVLDKPFKYVQKEMDTGKAVPSLVQHLLSDPPEAVADFEEKVKRAAATIFACPQIYSVVLAFILAMAQYPEAQRSAQAEIDRVVGTDRPPRMEDMPDLPYVNAVIKEAMRWRPTLPLGVPHRSTEDDVYGGFFIPKSTVILANVWAVAFQPDEKYEPQAFLPERFLDPAHPTIDPAIWAFGFGRRICPGRYLAENSLFMFISTLLWAFDISPPASGEIKVASKEYILRYDTALAPICLMLIPTNT